MNTTFLVSIRVPESTPSVPFDPSLESPRYQPAIVPSATEAQMLREIAKSIVRRFLSPST